MNRSEHFEALIKKAGDSGRVTFLEGDEVGTFDINLNGEKVCSLTDRDLGRKSPADIAEQVFGKKEKKDEAQTPEPVTEATELKPKRGRPKKNVDAMFATTGHVNS